VFSIRQLGAPESDGAFGLHVCYKVCGLLEWFPVCERVSERHYPYYFLLH